LPVVDIVSSGLPNIPAAAPAGFVLRSKLLVFVSVRIYDCFCLSRCFML
jgi:hypothetical protein